MKAKLCVIFFRWPGCKKDKGKISTKKYKKLKEKIKKKIRDKKWNKKFIGKRTELMKKIFIKQCKWSR